MGFTGVIHPEWVGNTQGARSCPARCIGPCSDVSDVPISRLGGVFTERGHLPVPRRAARITPVSMRSPRSAQCLFLARFARGYCCAWGSVLTTEYTPPRIARAGCCGLSCGTFRACGKRSRLRSEPWTTVVLPKLRVLAREPGGLDRLANVAGMTPRRFRDVLSENNPHRPNESARKALISLLDNSPDISERTCAGCGKPMTERRVSARYCPNCGSNRERQRRHRRR